MGTMVKRSMKGKAKAAQGADSGYDFAQLERKRLKKEGTIARTGPSQKPEFKLKKRKHRNRNRDAPQEAPESTTFVDEDEAAAEGELSARDQQLKRIKEGLAEEKSTTIVPRDPSIRKPISSGVSADKLKWKELLTEYLAQEDVEEGELKDKLQALLKYDNVPVNRAPKKFKNFVKESLAMFKQEELIESMWLVFNEVTKPLR